MPKWSWLLLLALVLIAAVLFLIVSKKPVSEQDLAISKAKQLYQQKKSEDLSAGPCLSNDLMPGWVADIAHSPRQLVDDLPQNQCSAYREGKASHFVELDPQGNLINVR